MSRLRSIEYVCPAGGVPYLRFSTGGLPYVVMYTRDAFGDTFYWRIWQSAGPLLLKDKDLDRAVEFLEERMKA